MPHRSRAPWLLALVLVAVVTANVAWIVLDTRGQPFMDPYVERTLTFVNSLPDGPLQTLPRRVAGLAVGPRPPLYQAATVPFVGPEAQERNSGRKFAARIGANECVFGISPKAAAAMAEAGKEIWKYCDPEGHDLRQALAAYHGIGMENIVLANGIDGLLGITARLFVEPGVGWAK